MNEVNLPDGFPRVAVLFFMEDQAFCSLCGESVPAHSITHDVKSCGAQFVAMASSLGPKNPRLKFRSDLKVLDIAPIRQKTEPIWVSPDDAEMLVRSMRLNQVRKDKYFTPTRANNVIRRLVGYRKAEMKYFTRREPFLGRLNKEGVEEIELRSVLEYFSGSKRRRSDRVGPKSLESLRKLVKWIDK